MSSHITEEQQLEQLKKFWKEYGLSIITGVVLALVIGFGWRFYRSYITQRAQTASVVYSRVMIDVATANLKDAQEQVNRLLSDYKHTPYSDLGALMLAKVYVTQNNLSQAKQNLNWVIDHAHTKTFKQLALIRMARLELADGQFQNALNALSKVILPSFLPMIEEVKGDVYVKMGEKDKARVAYQAALKALPEDAMGRSVLRMKLNDL